MGSIRRGLVIMAKQPIPGAVKTRLCPPLTPEESAAFANAFLRDTVANAQQAECGEVVLAVAPAEDAWFAGMFPGLARLPQKGEDLGKRLNSVFEAAWRLRYQPCVVMGTDSPDLPPALLHEAFEALRSTPDGSDVILGPAKDGGYTLIGLKWRSPQLFANIAWSTERVLEQTLERAAAASLRVHLLREWQDVDEATDLTALAARLADAPAEVCPHTRRLLTAQADLALFQARIYPLDKK